MLREIRQRLRSRRVNLALIGVLVAATPVASAEWVGEAIDLMGTRVSVELWHADSDVGRELVDQVLDEFRRIDAVMSTYRPKSEISLVNATAPAPMPTPNT